MYEDFYSMTRTPFVRNIPTDSIYTNEQIDNTLNRLGYACRHKQFALLIGPHGAGKTTMLRVLKGKLDPTEYIFIHMSERYLEPRMFYNRILNCLGDTGSHHYSTARIAVQNEIGKLQGKKVVVAVDDAQLLPYTMLDEIRFALSYNMDTENPFAFILSGTKEILKPLRAQDYSSTLNRIEMECFMKELTSDETASYIDHQLGISGCTTRIFNKDAVSKIYKYSQGFPILINRICRAALNLGAQNECLFVDAKMIEYVVTNEITLSNVEIL